MKTIIIKISVLLYFSFLLMLFASCEESKKNILTVTPQNIEFPEYGGVYNITIETDADVWNIIDFSNWISISKNTGTSKKEIVKLTVNTKTPEKRTDTLKITAGNADPVYIIVTQASSEYVYSLTANYASLSYSRAGGSVSVKITTDAPKWNIQSDAEWIQLSKNTGDSGTTTLSISALENRTINERSASITISANYAPTVKISVTQKGELYPSYNISPLPPDTNGMNSTAQEIASKIVLGWNLGNSLEATGGETAWGNPKVTKAFIDFVKQSGFNAIRIPCSWNQYMANSSTAQIKTDWLNRVKEVVQYCIDNDMYVLLNIHWDGGWLENNCTLAKQEENIAKQKAFWEQIATHLRDFDKHLMFASANEPNVSDATQMKVLLSYHQTFIDAVRSTGGKNKYRILVIQGPSTDIEKTNNLMSTLPYDSVPNKLMVEIHYYTPWNFCGLTEDASWGKMFYYWGKGFHSITDTERNATWGEESTVDSNFSLMKRKFVDKGIPVILGEYAVTRRSSLTGDALALHLASRAYFYEYVTKQAKANGILPFYWDNGGTGNYGCGIFNRTNNTVFDKQALDALIKGATEK
jgi:aryl-phospho-beta-D-glucosidase BglC (GH1 family)